MKSPRLKSIVSLGVSTNTNMFQQIRICVRVVSDIQPLAFGCRGLYIRYNTANHIVNSTYITLWS